MKSDLLKEKKLLMYSSDSGGCYYYRTKTPAEFLKADYSVGFNRYDEAVKDSDVIFLQRVYADKVLEWIKHMQSKGKKFVYDLDDNLWELSVNNPASRYYKKDVLNGIEKIIKQCDALVVSTQPLLDYFYKQEFNDNIHLIPNMLTIPENFEFKEKQNNNIVRIGWGGSPTHKDDFSYYLYKAFRKIKNKYQDKVQLVFMGYNPLNDLDSEFHKHVKVDEYLTYFNNLNLDIGVTPLENTIFNKGKSNLKYLEMSICNIPVVASDVYPYSTTITHNKNGLIVEDEKDWYNYLEYLIQNYDKRIELANNAKELVSYSYTTNYNGKLLIDKYNYLLESLELDNLVEI